MTRFLLEWVVTASLLILVVIALRALLGRRISAGLRYALWAVALIRLLVPLQFFSLPVPTVLPEVDKGAITANAAPDTTVPIQEEPVEVPTITAPQPSGVVVDHDVNVTPSAVTFDVMRLWSVLGWLWLAGATVMTAAFFLSNLTFALRLRRVRIPLDGVDCPLPLYLAEDLPSPCLFGLAPPTVYVTPEATDNPVMLRHVLAHEYTHYRHREYIWNILRSIALAVHWWNPLVWLAVILSRRDCELACDEGALKRLGDGERVAYGRTLLALLTEKPRPSDLLTCATTMTGGQKSVFDRVARIARIPKRWFWAAVVAVLVAALACVCAFGQATGSDSVDTPDLTADLSFTLDEEGTLVRIEGSVDGIELEHTLWFAPSWFEPYEEASQRYPLGQLWFQVSLCERTPSLDACWTDESKTAVRVTATPTATISSYFQSGNLSLTVDVSKGTLLELDGYIPKMAGGQAERVPTEEEAVRCGRIAAKLLTEAENYYQNHAENLSSQPVLELPEVPAIDSASYTLALDEYGVSVSITGLDCESAWWYSWPLKASFDVPEHALGFLDLWQPRFLGDHFLQYYSGCAALYSPEDNPDLVWIHASVIETDKVLCCTVNLSTAEIKNQQITAPGWENADCKLSDAEMLQVAQMLAQLIQEASDFYQASLPAPEDGPLPFDVPIKMEFASGVGGWGTVITLHPDGSFEGDYHDMDMGDIGSGYQSTEYVCQFHGRFGEIRQVTSASWSLTLEELMLDTGYPIDEEWIEANPANQNYNLRYISSAPYGFSKRDGEGMDVPLEPGAQFMFYTPDASGYRPTDELYGFNSDNEDYNSTMYQFWHWMPSPRRDAWGRNTKLDCYALCNMETGYGFFDLKAWGIG